MVVVDDKLREMKKRVDRLLKAVANEVEDDDLRIELIARLIAIRELLDGRQVD